MPDERSPELPDDTGEMLPKTDQAFFNLLARRLAAPERQGLFLSEATAAALDRLLERSPYRPTWTMRAGDLGRRAASDLAFETAMAGRSQRPSLGAYLAFLRQQAGLTVSEAAGRFRFEFQLLTDLERNDVSPQRIPGRRLADLVRRLKGSLEMAEHLISGAVRAPRYLPAGGRDVLYRRPRGGRSAAPGATASDRERADNPAFHEEVEAVRRLIDEMREAWSRP
jgi:transcriptional regulator with XRE-family HTH domain